MLIMLNLMLLSNAIAVRRDKPGNYLRTSVFIFLISALSGTGCLNFLLLENGIKIFSGLYQLTAINQIFQIFMLLVPFFFINFLFLMNLNQIHKNKFFSLFSLKLEKINFSNKKDFLLLLNSQTMFNNLLKTWVFVFFISIILKPGYVNYIFLEKGISILFGSFGITIVYPYFLIFIFVLSLVLMNYNSTNLTGLSWYNIKFEQRLYAQNFLHPMWDYRIKTGFMLKFSTLKDFVLCASMLWLFHIFNLFLKPDGLGNLSLVLLKIYVSLVCLIYLVTVILAIKGVLLDLDLDFNKNTISILSFLSFVVVYACLYFLCWKILSFSEECISVINLIKIPFQSIWDSMLNISEPGSSGNSGGPAPSGGSGGQAPLGGSGGQGPSGGPGGPLPSEGAEGLFGDPTDKQDQENPESEIERKRDEEFEGEEMQGVEGEEMQGVEEERATEAWWEQESVAFSDDSIVDMVLGDLEGVEDEGITVEESNTRFETRYAELKSLKAWELEQGKSRFSGGPSGQTPDPQLEQDAIREKSSIQHILNDDKDDK